MDESEYEVDRYMMFSKCAFELVGHTNHVRNDTWLIHGLLYQLTGVTELGCYFFKGPLMISDCLKSYFQAPIFLLLGLYGGGDVSTSLYFSPYFVSLKHLFPVLYSLSSIFFQLHRN